MKRVIVAGAAGYVGRNLVAALEGRAEVVGVDVAPGFLHPDGLGGLEGPFDAFVNLAWRGKGGPARADYALQMDSVKTALDFYREAVRLGCRRFICTGTIGELMVELPECAGLRSRNFIYINAKNFLHRSLRALEDTDGCRVVWARLGNLYGGGDSGGNIVDYTVGRLVAGEKAVFGPAEQPYDFVHARDCASALAALAVSERPLEGEFYVGSGDVRPLKDYLVEIGRIAGRPDLIEIGGRPDDGTRYRAEWFSIERLASETGYRPATGFEDGVRDLLAKRPFDMEAPARSRTSPGTRNS